MIEEIKNTTSVEAMLLLWKQLDVTATEAELIDEAYQHTIAVFNEKLSSIFKKQNPLAERRELMENFKDFCDCFIALKKQNNTIGQSFNQDIRNWVSKDLGQMVPYLFEQWKTPPDSYADQLKELLKQLLAFF